MTDHLEGSDQRTTHWERVYQGSKTNAVSWYQSKPEVSLDLIERLGLSPGSVTIDVGGGASLLVDRLLARGFTDLTVLDVSAAALHTSRQRVGDDAPVNWLSEDLLEWKPTRTYDLWHEIPDDLFGKVLETATRPTFEPPSRHWTTTATYLRIYVSA